MAASSSSRIVPALRLQRVVFTGWDHQSTIDELIPVAHDYPHVITFIHAISYEISGHMIYSQLG
jgi:hypothetical protein